MKNIKLIFISMIPFITILSSCGKNESPLILSKNETNNQKLEVEIEDGMLKFSNESELSNAVNFFYSLSRKQRIEWGKSHGIKTQQMIIDELSEIQTLFENKRYLGLDEDISLEEMRNLGLEPQWCPEILKYEELGLLKTKIEQDGSISFEVLNDFFGVTAVVNERGFVLIDSSIQLYANKKIKIAKHTPYLKETLLNSDIQNDKVKVFNFNDDRPETIFNERTYTIGNIFDQNSNDWVWYNVSSKERFNHYVRAYSYEYFQVSGTNYTLYSKFFTSSTAEKKRLLRWDKRDKYKPIRRINGSWDWKMWPLNTKPYISPNPGLYASNSPIYYSGLNTNCFLKYLEPTGFHRPHHAGDYIDYFDINIYGSFAGGASGYSTHYHN